MTSTVDIVNRALQTFGALTTVTSAQLAANSTNEAIQANLIMNNLRDDLLRLAPWDCALKTANLVYISSLPGTPENQSPVTAFGPQVNPRHHGPMNTNTLWIAFARCRWCPHPRPALRVASPSHQSQPEAQPPLGKARRLSSRFKQISSTR